MSTAATATTNAAALDAFMSRKAEALTIVEALRSFLAEGFADAIDPEEIHWGHVGDLERWIEQLNRIDLAGWGEG